MTQSEQVRIVITTEDKTGPGISSVTGNYEKVKKQTQSVGSSISSLSGTMALVATGAAAVGSALKAAFDLGREGAEIIQTRKSFESLMNSVGAAPFLLDKLREASSDTIPDMQLMSATTTLLAGASGDLAIGLADATPKLLEIAKAANKLNPSLGDTTFMYESLAAGIKRASPLMIDNLGIKIKIGEANERLAKSLGKTVGELTVEEQQMALLNETIRAGNVLIEQAGGAAGSATDSFSQFDTAMKNAADGMKTKFTPAASAVSSALATMVNWLMASDAAVDDQANALAEGYGSVAGLGGAYGSLAAEQRKAARATYDWNDAAREELRASKKLTEAHEELEPAIDQSAQTTWDARQAASEAARSYDEFWRKVIQTKEATEDLELAQADLASAQASFAQGAGRDFASVLESQFDSLPSWQQPANELEEGLRIIDEVMGTSTLSQYEMAKSQEELARQFAAGEISAEEFKESLQDWEDTWSAFDEDVKEASRLVEILQRQLDTLDGTYYINIEFQQGSWDGTIPGPGSSGGGYTDPGTGSGYNGANGLDFVVPPGYPGDSFRAPLNVSSGERVTVTPNGSSPSGGNTYNLTIRTTQSPRVVQRGFALERALAGV